MFYTQKSNKISPVFPLIASLSDLIAEDCELMQQLCPLDEKAKGYFFTSTLLNTHYCNVKFKVIGYANLPQQIV